MHRSLTQSAVPFFAAIGAAVGLAGVAGLGAGCNNNAIGAPCILNANLVDGGGSSDAGVIQSSVAINSTSLDCPSRLCMHFLPQMGGAGANPPALPTSTDDFCTAECGSDSDCNPGNPGTKGKTDYCIHGYKCVTPILDPGPFCCKRMCVCQDRLSLGLDGGVPNEPPAQCKNPSYCAGTNH